MAVRSAIKTALRKNEAVINSSTRFKRRKSTKRKWKSLAITKPNFPSSAIFEMKSVLESVLDSNMDSGSKLIVIKTILGQK
jgi:hypothetical protein